MEKNKIPQEIEKKTIDEIKKYTREYYIVESDLTFEEQEIRLALLKGRTQTLEKVLKLIDELRNNLILRLCRPNKPVNTFENAKEQEEIICEEFEELKQKLTGDENGR
jgi:hypothetical protein